MIPLSFFLVAWLVLVAIFGLMSMLTVYMNIKNGITTFGSYVTTAIFLGVSLFVILGVGGYLLTIDWTQTVGLFSMPTVPLL